MDGLRDRRYRVADSAGSVVSDVVAQRDELEALCAAIAWRRERLAATPLDDADAVLAVRALASLDERLADTIAAGPPTPLTIDREQALLLTEIAGAYVGERDFDGYAPPEERERIALLTALTGPLMDTCCELAAAADEARAASLSR
ncbi:MAG TPA: hypothetical protein VHX88_21045 [Solirubrobacteraceae bacterium]|jgi:hypothetical protein|nr:hypothetical protein [Solirubrobacteraceae bacterium]